MNKNAFFKISYGLYVLSAKENEKDNGCIINTVTQVTQTPSCITIAVNKDNLTHDMIVSTGEFNVSILDETSDFDIFKNFGYQSGRTSDKFADIPCKRSENGIFYLSQSSNAFISAKVVSSTDLGTHTLFLAEVTDCEILSKENSVTYDYYQNNIKPAPEKPTKSGYRCSICNYVYEGDELPEDFICPICKHNASDFVKI